MQGMNVGIEHTEEVPTNTAHEQALRSEGVGSATHLIRRALPNEPRKTKEEITQEILADELGDFWEGDSPEREWAEAIAQCVTVKIQKATASGYTYYKKNWLMVYDNWPLPHVDLEKAACFLQTKLDGMDAFANFDQVFVSNEAQICEFRNSGFAIRALVRP